MKQWDSAASAHLKTVTSELRAVGVARLLEEQVRAVWQRNVDAHDPLLGDTSLSLGVACSENLRELVVGTCAGDGSVWRRRGVGASTVDRSLRVEVRGVRLGLMKAPPSRVRTPDWTGAAFHWEQESDVRRTAAERNSVAYRPTDSDQADRQLALAEESGPLAAAAAMRDFLVVWSGQVESALTAGWLGIPSLGGAGWFAVELLWRDESGEDGARARDDDSPSDGDSFADLPAPQPGVSLKERRDVAGDQQQS